MPSKKHERIKRILNIAALRLKEKGKLPISKHMRPVLEAGTLFSLLPWGVHFKKVGLKHGNCFRTLAAEIIIPSNAKNTSQVIIYLHGGGYTIGSSHTHRALVGKLVKLTKRVAIIPEYRKAPENPYPAALEDAFFTYKAMLDRGKIPKDIILVGDSAGGGLVIALQVYLMEKKMPLPGAGVCLSPWVDLDGNSESIELNKNNDPLVDIKKMKQWSEMYCGEYPATHPKISPIYANLNGLSPLLIQASDSEMLYNDATRLAEKAKKEGVDVTLQIWEGLMHWWHLFQKTVPEAREAIEKVSDFILNVFEDDLSEKLEEMLKQKVS